MSYTIFINIIRFLVFILNGRIKVVGIENVPQDENYLLVAPHRSWLDPIGIVPPLYPQVFSFMAKEELRESKMLNFIIDKLDVVTVNRDNPGPSALKKPVQILKKGEKNFFIFPSGSRYSEDLKDGAVTIARLSGKKILPAVYVGPLNFKDFLKRKRMAVAFGEPIVIEKNRKEFPTELYNEEIKKIFDELDESLAEYKIN